MYTSGRFAWSIGWGAFALLIVAGGATLRYASLTEGFRYREAVAYHASQEPNGQHRLIKSFDPHQVAFSGPIFRLPLAPQESLLVWIGGDGSSVLQYGVGNWVPLLERWRKTKLFSDADQARVLLPLVHEEELEGEYSALSNKKQEFTEKLVPVHLRDGVLSVDTSDLPPIQWGSPLVMRVRTEPEANSLEGVLSRVEVAYGDSKKGREVVYMRGDNGGVSKLTLTDPAFVASPGANKWVIAIFEPREKEVEKAHERLVVIGVLSGKFVSRLDNAFSLQASEAVCLRVDMRANRVAVLQPAKLETGKDRLVMRWQEVEQAYEPSEVWLYRCHTSDPKERLDNLFDVVWGSIPLNPCAMWLTQRAAFDF